MNFKIKILAIALLLLSASPAYAAGHFQGRNPRMHKPTPPPPVVVPPPPVTGTLQLGAFNSSGYPIQVGFVGWKDAPICYSGKTTFLYWENTGTSLDSIINGSEDSAIQTFSAKLCQNTILAIFHEMNGNWDDWGGTVGNNTPAKLVAAYRHIHDLIGSKVKWAWVINNNDVPDQTGNRPSDYYPGDAYVDIVGVDGFDWGGQTFLNSISPNYDLVKTYPKPIWITSFGTSGHKSAWITDAIAQAKAKGIGALIYFNYDQFQMSLTAFHL